MRKLYSIIIAVLISFNLIAQLPQKMSYQSVIRNSSNQLVTSHTVGMRISILQGSATGTPVYIETQTPTTNANGLATIEIGGGLPVTGTFAGINWSTGTYFIKTETDPFGGTSYTITGTSQLFSVPYALYAKTAESITGSSIGFTHYIGELYGGGIIVAVWKVSGIEHGLIASLTDIGSSGIWSNVGSIAVGITAQNHFDGQANTNAIIGQVGHTNSAAKLCDNYTSGGFTDWYLPAIWELKQCFNAALIVNNILGAIDGFQIASYWTSNELTSTDGNTGAYVIKFSYNGELNGGNKAATLKIRAVRKF